MADAPRWTRLPPLGHHVAQVPPPADAHPTRLITASGTVYELDPHAMTALRIPHGGAGLRRDGEPLHLLAWPRPVLGERMLLHLMVREDVTPTLRWTTPVICAYSYWS